MITRRSLFASLAGLAVAPAVAPTAPVAYESDNWYLVSYDEQGWGRIVFDNFPPTLPPGAADTVNLLLEKARSNLKRGGHNG